MILTPEFDPEVNDYTANTSNNTNNITAVTSNEIFTADIYVNGTQHDNNTSATWITGLNEVYILLLEDDEPVNDVYYKVVVTKSGILSPLTVTSVAGNEAGKTSVSIDENRIAGTVYYYKTAQAVDVPELDDVIEQDWTLWNGIDEITATNGDEIVFVEALALGGINYVKSAGKGIVVTQQ